MCGFVFFFLSVYIASNLVNILTYFVGKMIILEVDFFLAGSGFPSITLKKTEYLMKD